MAADGEDVPLTSPRDLEAEEGAEGADEERAGGCLEKREFGGQGGLRQLLGELGCESGVSRGCHAQAVSLLVVREAIVQRVLGDIDI